MVLPLLLALSVTASDAICAVRGWTRQGGTLTVIGAPVKADRFETSAGNAFYAVKTSEGTVFTAADTDYEPILAFTSSVADFSEIDPASPLWALMTKSADNAVYSADAFARWQELLAKGEFRRMLLALDSIDDISDIGDLRVEPLTESKWSQGSVNGKYCYNYYTPANFVCGCVATALAQTMYYHKYPTGPITAITKKCWYNGSVTNCTMKGGVYDWATMVDDPSKDASDEAREAIGKLTYDCGVATHMRWRHDSKNSATYDLYAETALYSNFNYKSATYTECDDILQEINLGKTILCNLDAMLPVMLGICGVSGGHAIIADGYGYKDGILYIHLNMGWANDADIWYHLPDLNTGNISFNTVTDVVYNIIPGTTIKGVFSGRILNESKHPVAGQMVGVYDKNGNALTNLTTNAQGVYAFVSPKQENFTVRIDGGDIYEAFVSDAQTLHLPSAISTSQGLDEPLMRWAVASEDLGNSWGNDFTLKAKPVSVSLDETTTENVSIPPSWFAKYGLVADVADTTTIQSVATNQAANGINSVAECYVIGISPTNETAQFTASISFDAAGNPQIDYDPNLGSARTYRKLCSDDLKSWREWTGEGSANFFKVEVSK